MPRAQLIPTAIRAWVSEGMQDTPEQVYNELRQSLQMLSTWFE